MPKLPSMLAGIIIGLMIGGCGAAVAKDKNKEPTGYFNQKTLDDDVSEIGWHEILTPEGKKLQCVWIQGHPGDESSYMGGPSCNWEAYNK